MLSIRARHILATPARMLAYSSLCLALFACQERQTAEVVVSIGPLYGLTAAIMNGVDTPGQLIQSDMSPHTFSLRPSEVHAVAAAKLVIWIGPDMERPLSKLVKARPIGNVLTLQDSVGIKRLHRRATASHHNLVSEAYDPHIWLSPDNARVMAQAITEVLAADDPANAVNYRRNMKDFLRQLTALEGEIANLLQPLRGKTFMVLHDSTQYFEEAFGLSVAGVAEPSHDLPAGAARIKDLIALIEHQQPSCLIHEVGSGSKLPDLLARETGIKLVIADPLGREVAPTPQAYFDLLRALAHQMHKCLMDEAPVQ